MRALKILVFVACLGPLGWLVWGLADGTLGANPAEASNRFLGDWALRFLLLTLAVTPLRQISGRGEVGRFRRMLGLYAFFYATLHVTSYVVLDQFFDWAAIWADLLKRTYITIGMGALLLLLPLAVTSTKGMIQRLGGARWRKLHRLVYPAAILVVVHFYMMVRARETEVLIHGAVLAGLLGWRVWKNRRAVLPMLQRP
ncbi:sulfoxide reductase heme-binding subunit YedZ [Magnetospira thiophila]